jgi:hypothetical protein
MNKNLISFTACLIAFSVLIFWLAAKYSNSSYLLVIVAALAVATFVAYFFLNRSASENFIKNYLLTIVVKLLAGGVFIAAIIFNDQEGAEANALTFMAAYLLFTMLEIGFLFSKFNKG